MLLWHALVAKVDIIGDILERNIQLWFDPLRRICNLATYIESIRLAEIIVPLIVVADVALQVIVGGLVLDICLGG